MTPTVTVAPSGCTAPGHHFQPVARHLISRAADHDAAIGGEIFAHINRIAGGGDRRPEQAEKNEEKTSVKRFLAWHEVTPVMVVAV